MKTKSKFTRIIGMAVTVAMLTSMLVTAAPALADVSSATVSVTPATISTGGNYTITFDVNGSLTASNATGNITIVFPSNTVTSNASLIGNVTVQSTAGFGTAVVETTIAAAGAVTVGSNLRTVTIRLGDLATAIGEAATVRVKFRNGSITNPSAPSTNYTLTVATGNDTTAITSAPYTITLLSIAPLPGTVTGKNSAGNVLYQDITSNLTPATNTTGVTRIELGAGTYNATNVAPTLNQTIIGVGAAGTVILTAGAGGVPLTISNYGVVIENVVIQGNVDGTANLTSITANATLRNVTFNGGVSQIATGSSAVVTVENCLFNVTGNVSRGITTVNATVVNSSTFTVDSSGTAISNTGNLTVTGSIFTGSGTSTGISVSSTVSSTNNTAIRSSTFTSLRQALVSGNQTVEFVGNTITGGGESTASDTTGVITVTAGSSLLLLSNTITNWNNAYYALHVTDGNLTARFNSITSTGTILNARRTGGTANATHNYWGSATGPASSSINGTVTTTPYLKSAPSAGTVAFTPTSNLTAQTTSGVDISTANGTVNYAIASKYAANPETVAPPGTPVAYFDVSIGVTSGAEPGSVTIRFYANVVANSKVYYGGGLAGGWTEVQTQGVNVNGGYAYVVITGTSIPNYADLTGTPFVVTSVVPPPGAPTLTGPAAGATGVPTNTGFSWLPVTGATYDFQISTSATFATLTANVSGLTGNVYGGVALAANTTYFWRVRSVTGTVVSAYTTSAFTTAAPAAPTAPPVINVAPPTVNVAAPPPATVTVQAPPPAVVNVAPPAITVQAPPPAQVTVNVPEQAPLIPQYLLWTILLIGAVLVIALIVLIVRTRRVA